MIPPADGLDDVTYGYVPWSMSNITPCAPSNKIFLFSFCASSNTLEVSVTYWANCFPYSKYSLKISSTVNPSVS